MSVSKPVATKSRVMYALSIHMKYGEVLHIEGLSKEEKDQYYELARHENQTMIVEDKASVRHLLSKDIAKISAKAYDEKYQNVYHPIEKMLFSESSLGRRLFTLIIKAFIVISILSIIGMFGLSVVDGTIMDVLFESDQFLATVSKGFDVMNTLFGFTVALMILLNVMDIILGLRAHYYINQDGADPVEVSRISNAAVTLAFIVIFLVAKTVIGGLSSMI